jgi:hypothetical protein
MIYHKGGNSSEVRMLLDAVRARVAHPASVKAVLLPNAPGREGHTIAHHIAENWNHLALVTTFVQGDVKADHMVPIVELHDALVRARQHVMTEWSELTHTFGVAAPHHGSADAARAIVQRMASVMQAATPNTGAACLCHASELPPLLCEADSGPDARSWPCPTWFREAQHKSHGALQQLGGYTSLMGFVMHGFLGEQTWPGMRIPWCNAGALSVTVDQARAAKPVEWWLALRQLLERDRKIKWVSALRMAHVFERLWLRIFSSTPIQGGSGDVSSGGKRRSVPSCLDDPNATCCVKHHECCCPTRRRAPAGREEPMEVALAPI